MKILILGSGGREHALAWRLAQDSTAEHVYVWPGNAGMFLDSNFQPVQVEFSLEAFERFIRENAIDLVIPGAEKFLYEGVSDLCKKHQVLCFGPGKKASMLERSKLFAKNVMNDGRIPTARFTDLTALFSDVESCRSILESYQRPVIKISGPSLGKGVFVCENSHEAMDVLYKIKQHPLEGLEEGIFVEEGLKGKEVSLFFACHEETFSFLGAAQDHKRLKDNDEGPNTGGMGTIAPVPWVDADFINQAARSIVRPTLKVMKERGQSFSGVLFLGLMVDGHEMRLLEYNVRFGDPETQVLMPLIDGDFAAFLQSLLQNKLNTDLIKLKRSHAVHVVKAARGYPGTFGEEIERGQEINLNFISSPEAKVFFAGVKKVGEKLVTNGGRVLGLTARGLTAQEARLRAYEILQKVSFQGEQFRRDIGGRT